MEHLSDVALDLLERRYFLRDEEGEVIENWDGIVERVSMIARPEYREEVRELLYNLDFLPNSPTWMNAGTDKGTLSACFVVPVPDSMEGIFKAIRDVAIITKNAGGIGISMARIRPNGDSAKNRQGVASGVISFLKIFDQTLETVKQGARRGAGMCVLPVHHPDIFEFLDAKKEENVITNFNLSVGITDYFMECLENGTPFPLINPRTEEIVRYVDPKEIWDKIVYGAWRNGEPGVIFLDTINKENMVSHLGDIEATNPCGEQPLLSYGSCNLGSINLFNMLFRNEQGQWEIDWLKLENTVNLAVKFLDDVIDNNNFPLPEIEKHTKQVRDIGLGVMGFADVLIMMGIPYDSEEAVDVANEIGNFILEMALRQSRKLAQERGVFPAWKGSAWSEVDDKIRNASVTTIAPTGTISMIAGVSSGIEPMMGFATKRKTFDGQTYFTYPKSFRIIAEENGFWSEDLPEKIFANGGIKGLKEIPEKFKRIFQTIEDIPAEQHIEIQSAWQYWTTNAVSKTINAPNDHTVEEVDKAFRLAYESGCKGTTYYRDGSREEQVIITKEKIQFENGSVIETIPSGDVIRGKCSEKCYCTDCNEDDYVYPSETLEYAHAERFKIKTGCGSFWLFICYDDDGNLKEIFSQSSTTGGCRAMTEALSRMTSLAIKSNVHPDYIIDQLRSVKCDVTMAVKKEKGLKIKSCSDGIGKALAEFLNKPKREDFIPKSEYVNYLQMPLGDYRVGVDVAKETIADESKCPDCGAKLKMIEGCISCSCGYSKCS